MDHVKHNMHNARGDKASIGDKAFMPRERGPGIFIALTLLCLMGWVWLGLMIASMAPTSDMNAFGPGMAIVNFLTGIAELPGPLRDALLTICSVDGRHFGMPSNSPWTLSDLFLIFIMWLMMALAMMLPTAASMIVAFHQQVMRQETMRQETMEGLSRYWSGGATALLVCGYLFVWAGYAGIATIVQWGLTNAAWMSPHVMVPMNMLLAASALLAAGLYQFTPAKKACLGRCQLAAQGRGNLVGITIDQPFSSGVWQGLWCAGSCWALMTVMFAVGVMNVVWIAILALIMTAEKMIIRPWLPNVVGAGLIGWGGAIIVTMPAIRNLPMG